MMLLRKVTAVILCLSGVLTGVRYGDGEEMPIYKCGNTKEKRVALTFDDGPHPEYTPEILNILEEYSVSATFFVVGKNAEEYPDIVKQEIEMGCEVGNHTYTHPNIRKTNECELEREIAFGEESLCAITGKKPHLFRPPGGVCTKNARNISGDLGYSIILWNIDTRDWEKPSKEKIISQVKNELRAGAIILFHDYIYGDSPTPEALKEIIPYLLSEGYEIVTVSELLGL